MGCNMEWYLRAPTVDRAGWNTSTNNVALNNLIIFMGCCTKREMQVQTPDIQQRLNICWL